MAHRFSQLMFTAPVQALQSRHGSRGAYEQFAEPEAPANDRLGALEQTFLSQRDSFYMASISQSGWPYVQHRGGPKGFLKVLDERTIGFADYSGNRQYVSVGNFATDDRVSLILVDYLARRRLKVLGRVRILERGKDDESLAQVQDESYPARVERGIMIAVEAFDWNCPQHIVPRYTEEELRAQFDFVERISSKPDRVQRVEAKAFGDGPLPLIVSGIRQLTPRVRAYELRHAEHQPLPAITAGAHLAVPIAMAGHTHWRSYSIARTGPCENSYEIAVLADGDGSRVIHESYQIGARINCRMPRNDFALGDESTPAVLIAGGIGITPIRKMAEELDRCGRAFELHYAVRSRAEAAYLDELESLCPDRLIVYERSVRPMVVSDILASCGTGAHIYACGPERMIEDVIASAQEAECDLARIHLERFGKRQTDSEARPFTIRIPDYGVDVNVGANQTALDALVNAGFEVPSDCRAGNCGTCSIALKSGQVEHKDAWSLSLGPTLRNRQFTPCVSRALTDTLVVSFSGDAPSSS
ncbi:pyridoxamine 5'-phosphate oxidase [Pseudorhizobium endolithicum]|uniref:Pyridoxamine 5'-phosphate oxidase n=1 Tax=Pseudorhizobium endolithicum TaxID=1191678 RepID=A0ABN7JX66_9HYPH|nr:2Fe-2S iron-sulfur cluster-binding protein [Pseudorhizobium endolithicum]CAD7052691.1 pyridoxamine 5'-phosphate oxidase [Pseudorhizobium endolithicum]